MSNTGFHLLNALWLNRPFYYPFHQIFPNDLKVGIVVFDIIETYKIEIIYSFPNVKDENNIGALKAKTDTK